MTQLAPRRFARLFHAILGAALFGMLAACGGGAADSPPDWYYHWNCNGDSECLATNPTGAASGTLNEGPNESSCTELLTFGDHFWGPAATQSCDHDANGSSGGGSVTVSSFSPTATAPGNNVTISGSGFDSGTTVTVDGVTATIVSVGSSSLVFTVPVVPDGPATVVVGGLTASGFTVVNHLYAVAPLPASAGFVAAGYAGTLLTSGSGVSWSAETSNTLDFLNGIAVSGSTDVVVGDRGVVLSSSDGSTWTARTSGTTETLYGIERSSSLFVAVGAHGTILKSSTGATWSAATSPTSTSLDGVAWSGAQFLACGQQGTLLTSPDGSTWTAQAFAGVAGKALFHAAFGNSVFVVVGEGGTIITSPDGVAWTSQISNTTQDLFGIVWSGTQFVAVGNHATILTSPDGVNWTARSSTSTQSLNAVTFANGTYTVVGGFGTILTSPDGIAWTRRRGL